MKILFIFMTFSVPFCTIADESDPNVVQTKDGKLNGLNETVDGETVFQFRKVPFAKPPIGDLRFRKPEPRDPWNGTYDATQYGPACYQARFSSSYQKFVLNTQRSEDCLYMNIYIPRTLNPVIPKAVMVYIHGGGYYTKSANLYDGSRVALLGDVIVILINYRIGMFGFLSTEDENSKGNYGLFDQIQALTWVQRNIEHFGGDPSKVTVIGHSAGGYSIGLLTLSKYSVGLFKRAVAMSGFGLSPRALTSGARTDAFKLGDELGCFENTARDSTILLECLRNKTSEEIRKATSSVRASYASRTHFIMRPAPVVDGDLLQDFPYNILADKNSDGYKMFKSVDFMAGTMDSDGWLLKSKLRDLEATYEFDLDDGVPTDAMCKDIITALVRDCYDSNTEISRLICEFYSTDISLVDQGRKTINMYGDMMYTSRGLESLRIHTDSNKQTSSYQFLFTHQPSFRVISSRVDWLTGAQHGDECWFIFRIKTFNYTDEELEFNNQFVRYLTNFVKFGNPNGEDPTQGVDPQWPPFTTNSEYYMNLSLASVAKERVFEDRMNFWLKTVPGEINGGASLMKSHLMLLLTVFLLLLNS